MAAMAAEEAGEAEEAEEAGEGVAAMRASAAVVGIGNWGRGYVWHWYDYTTCIPFHLNI
jgi:hypothetical protein